jgi:hypothetical protein
MHVAVRDDQSVRRQVVEESGGALEEQAAASTRCRRWRQPVADVLVDRRLRRVAFEAFAPATAKRGARGFVHRELAPGQQAHAVDRVQAALGVRIEGPDRFDLVAEQVEPIGQGGEPIGNRSISPPRTLYSPGRTTCDTWS